MAISRIKYEPKFVKKEDTRLFLLFSSFLLFLLKKFFFDFIGCRIPFSLRLRIMVLEFSNKKWIRWWLMKIFFFFILINCIFDFWFFTFLIRLVHFPGRECKRIFLNEKKYQNGSAQLFSYSIIHRLLTFFYSSG